jgi:hypothetical protein
MAGLASPDLEQADVTSTRRHKQSADVIRRSLAFFLPVAVLAVLGSGLIYLEVQQDLRSGANDPQFQMAEDAAAKLNTGATPSFVVNRAAGVDLSTSLATFVIVFDSNHNVLASDATLDGGVPVPPAGMLQAATPDSPSAVTWEPRSGVRVAAVTAAWNGGFVLVGRSLRRVEQQEDNAGLIASVSLVCILAGLAFASLAAAWLWPRRRSSVQVSQREASDN